VTVGIDRARLAGRMNVDGHVLLIETAGPTRLHDALVGAGLDVTWARGGVRAIATTAACADVATVVLDSDGTHGLDLVTYFRHRFPAAPLVFLTTSGPDVVEHAARARGAAVCVRRSSGPAAVVATVERVLRGGAAGSQPAATRPREHAGALRHGGLERFTSGRRA
jgi:DNA-binding response OmpR family regulator